MARKVAEGWREIGDFVVYEREPRSDTGHVPAAYSFPGATEFGFVRMREHWEGPVIKAIAEHFEFDRLHMDPEVDPDDADDFKMRMVQRALDSRWPILTCGQPMTLGFLIVRPDGNLANIDLIGIHPEYRGQHIGFILVDRFLLWALENGFEHVRAGTMAANKSACRLYESVDFEPVQRLVTLHK